MRVFATAILISLVCTGCTTTRDSAVTIATRALADRKLPLPANHSVRVSEGFCAVEFEQSYKLWIVEFRADARKDPLYSVWIDQRFGIVTNLETFRFQTGD
jgi:hypothetical protein